MLEVAGLTKLFDGENAEVRAVDDVSFRLPEGKVLTLLGPSGCGKTTTLRSIAGLERPSLGRIAINGCDVFDAGRDLFIPANERDIAMVFQSYAIWPNMNVAENVSFPLRMLPRSRRPSPDVITREVSRVLGMVQLSGYERRPATRLSGGQQQRLAVARALIRQPKVLLLDEPLSNLDARLREHMREELSDLHQRLGLTMVYVTHDQEEALALSDIVAVMHNGRVEQIGTPEEVYFRPRTAFVADFLGATNMLSGRVSGRVGEMVTVESAGGRLTCWAAPSITQGERVQVSVRPENLAVSDKPQEGAENPLSATLEKTLFLGKARQHVVKVGDVDLRAFGSPEKSFEKGQSVYLSVAAGNCVALPLDSEVTKRPI